MGSTSPAAGRYRETAIRTASPLQLVVILYDAAIQALREAQEHLKHGDIAGRSRSINLSVAAISELQASLNFRAGGQIAFSLDRLYNYMKHRVFAGNIEQKPEPLVEVVSLLENLRSAWQQLAAQDLAAGEANPQGNHMPDGWSPGRSSSNPHSTSLNISG